MRRECWPSRFRPVDAKNGLFFQQLQSTFKQNNKAVIFWGEMLPRHENVLKKKLLANLTRARLSFFSIQGKKERKVAFFAGWLSELRALNYVVSPQIMSAIVREDRALFDWVVVAQRRFRSSIVDCGGRMEFRKVTGEIRQRPFLSSLASSNIGIPT